MNSRKNFSPLSQPSLLAAVSLLTMVLVVVLARGAALADALRHNAGYTGVNNALTNPTEPLIERSIKSFESVLDQDDANAAASHGLALLYILQGSETTAIEAWRNGGVSAGYIMPFGKAAQLTGNHEEAFRWFDRAVRLEPLNGDAWFRRGQALGQMGRWKEAVANFEHVLDDPAVSLRDSGTSDLMCAVGWTYHWLSEPAQPRTAQIYYAQAVQTADFTSADLQAECLYKQAELFLWKLSMPQEAVQSYRAALLIVPDDPRIQQRLESLDIVDTDAK